MAPGSSWGRVTGVDSGDGSVHREVLSGRVPAGATRARFTGASVTPADVGTITADDAQLPRTRSGAWRFGPDLADTGTADSTWVVHTHGLGASPLATLRSVQSVLNTGLPSLVVSLGSAFAERRTGAETRDVARVVAAIDDAVALGATRVIVCGWSYGAALSLAAARERRDVVTAAILVSPMLSLRETVLHAAETLSIPRVLARSALAVLQTPLLARCAGVRGAVPVEALSEGLVAGLPTLAIHSPGDATIPIDLTRAATRTTQGCTLAELPSAPHGLEWNVAPDAFASTVEDWLATVLQNR